MTGYIGTHTFESPGGKLLSAQTIRPSFPPFGVHHPVYLRKMPPVCRWRYALNGETKIRDVDVD
ncbi:hypothetical protein D9615_003321 [Tricholomella constricta]|uniref:Uncharacterized protein n=1 Tax=Tricholomella constricta TaxID=117010 RepID=A0A8H5HJY0_9AGAR|nr:hypothetical protein D9615_003321 [Tricholomella constricta]